MAWCRHVLVDDKTWNCLACGERMMERHWVRRPGSPPTIGLIDVTYDCARCPGCGFRHRGEPVRLVGVDEN